MGDGLIVPLEGLMEAVLEDFDVLLDLLVVLPCGIDAAHLPPLLFDARLHDPDGPVQLGDSPLLQLDASGVLVSLLLQLVYLHRRIRVEREHAASEMVRQGERRRGCAKWVSGLTDSGGRATSAGSQRVTAGAVSFR